VKKYLIVSRICANIYRRFVFHSSDMCREFEMTGTKRKAVRFASANAVGIRETAAIIARVINSGSYSEAC